MTSSVHNPQAAPLGFDDEAAEILHGAEIGVDRAIVGDIVAVVPAGRGIERQQPKRGDAKLLQIAKLFGSRPAKSPMPSLCCRRRP